MKTPQLLITPEKRLSSDHFIVDDLLDFTTDDIVVEEEDCTAYVTDVVAGTSTDSSTVIDSCNLSGSVEPSLAGDMGCLNFVDAQMSNLYVPYDDDLAEFEWLTNVVEESFSNEDMQKLQLISGIKARSKFESKSHQFQPRTTNNSVFNIDMTIPGKARTKRSRVASCNWASRLPVTSLTTSNISSNAKSFGNKNMTKKESYENPSKNEEGRRCLHCDTNNTPQWRVGPMGPKTLCNACGVRYKSGRLVPEYRPAASPTFVHTKHSNSHRKVLELRRQKEMRKSQQHQQQQGLYDHQNVMLHISNGHNYLIHRHIGFM